MPRTLGKLTLDGRDLTGFVPVRCRTELGMCTGHVEIPETTSVNLKDVRYTLHLKDHRQMRISFSGVCGPLAYFHSVSADVENPEPVLV